MPRALTSDASNFCHNETEPRKFTHSPNSYVLFSAPSEDFKPGSQHLRHAEKTVSKRQGWMGEPGYIRVFAAREQVVGTSKDYS